MSDSTTANFGGPIEVWRGGVSAWECDEMGHLNVRFYVARATEGLVGVAAALGMTDAFAARAQSTLIVREHHIRFLREAHVGAALHMTAGVVEMTESEAVVLQVLTHSLSGETCATFLTRVSHAVAHDGRAFAWPARSLAMAQSLRTGIPAEAAPRGVAGGPVDSQASLAQAEALGMNVSGRGAVKSQDCDVFGRMAPELIMTRVGHGLAHFIEPLRAAAAQATSARMGSAALEYRLVYIDMPRAGDGVELRSGIAEIQPKYARMVHWLLNPRTGAPYAVAEHIVANFDLDARRLAPIPPETLATVQAMVIPGLTL